MTSHTRRVLESEKAEVSESSTASTVVSSSPSEAATSPETVERKEEIESREKRVWRVYTPVRNSVVPRSPRMNDSTVGESDSMFVCLSQ